MENKIKSNRKNKREVVIPDVEKWVKGQWTRKAKRGATKPSLTQEQPHKQVREYQLKSKIATNKERKMYF